MSAFSHCFKEGMRKSQKPQILTRLPWSIRKNKPASRWHIKKATLALPMFTNTTRREEMKSARCGWRFPWEKMVGFGQIPRIHSGDVCALIRPRGVRWLPRGHDRPETGVSRAAINYRALEPKPGGWSHAVPLTRWEPGANPIGQLLLYYFSHVMLLK